MSDRPLTVSSAGAVCSVDERASAAGVAMLAAGGTAADAAIAASAALTVTTQHMCGLGGDLFALVHHGAPAPDCLNSSGRAGSGADPQRLRDEGHEVMPFRDDVRSAPVPGCVDGWLALHDRHGRLPLAQVLAPAIELARDGFEVPRHLAIASERVAGVADADAYQGLAPGDTLRRPEVAEGLERIAAEGRQGWYLGPFGEALLEVGGGEYTRADLERSQAEWVEPLHLDAWGHRLWTVPPNSQGYITLAAAGILQGVEVPEPETGAWAHLHIEAARLAGHDRAHLLHDRADGAALIAPDRLAARRALLHPDRRSDVPTPAAGGGTIHLCATDAAGAGVSLIQSNASGFGCHVVVPGTGVFLHNRGVGFSLEPGHPAEYRPGRRPPHTLSPALVTRPDGSLRTVLGTMGGDAQPQIVLQLLSRLLHAGQDPAQVLRRPRWVLEIPGSHGFDTWPRLDEAVVVVEPDAASWVDALEQRGHAVECREVNAGHAHLIDIDPEGVHHGAAEPRISTAAALAPS